MTGALASSRYGEGLYGGDVMSYNESDWWELRVGEELLLRIHGRDRAEWFLENMERTDPLLQWELVSCEGPRPVSPDEILMKREVMYCIGSD